jgi:hypothetical protein
MVFNRTPRRLPSFPWRSLSTRPNDHPDRGVWSSFRTSTTSSSLSVGSAEVLGIRWWYLCSLSSLRYSCLETKNKSCNVDQSTKRTKFRNVYYTVDIQWRQGLRIINQYHSTFLKFLRQLRICCAILGANFLRPVALFAFQKIRTSTPTCFDQSVWIQLSGSNVGRVNRPWYVVPLWC